MREIPKPLIDQIRNKTVVLFLGSGFTYNSLHPDENKSPLGQELANLLAEKFLGDEYLGQPLTYI